MKYVISLVFFMLCMALYCQADYCGSHTSASACRYAGCDCNFKQKCQWTGSWCELDSWSTCRCMSNTMQREVEDILGPQTEKAFQVEQIEDFSQLCNYPNIRQCEQACVFSGSKGFQCHWNSFYSQCQIVREPCPWSMDPISEVV